jgi:hypothetical protein
VKGARDEGRENVKIIFVENVDYQQSEGAGLVVLSFALVAGV